MCSQSFFLNERNYILVLLLSVDHDNMLDLHLLVWNNFVIENMITYIYNRLIFSNRKISIPSCLKRVNFVNQLTMILLLYSNNYCSTTLLYYYDPSKTKVNSR